MNCACWEQLHPWPCGPEYCWARLECVRAGVGTPGLRDAPQCYMKKHVCAPWPSLALNPPAHVPILLQFYLQRALFSDFSLSSANLGCSSVPGLPHILGGQVDMDRSLLTCTQARGYLLAWPGVGTSSTACLVQVWGGQLCCRAVG